VEEVANLRKKKVTESMDGSDQVFNLADFHKNKQKLTYK
jgi:hypothetical protein